MVADELNVDPVALHNGSNDMLDSVGEAALSFVNHEDGLADAAPGWIGSSSRRWVSWRAGGSAPQPRQTAGGRGLGSHVADAMTRYVSNEDESAQAVSR